MELSTRMMSGRSMVWQIYHHFELTEIVGAMMDFNDLLNVTLKGDNLSQFRYTWGMTLAGMKGVPKADHLESNVRNALQP